MSVARILVRGRGTSDKILYINSTHCILYCKFTVLYNHNISGVARILDREGDIQQKFTQQKL